MRLFKRKVYETRQEKRRDFIIGVGIWLAANGLIAGVWALMISILYSGTVPDLPIYRIATQILLTLPWLVNVTLIVYFGFTRGWIALGMLSVFAILYLLAMIAAMLLVAYCFVVMSNPNGF